MNFKLSCFCFFTIVLFAAYRNADAVRGKTFRIRYPKNGGNYQPNTIRRWKVATDPGDCLSFKLRGLSMEESPGCINDSLSVFDGNSLAGKKLLRTCGFPRRTAPAFRSSGQNLFVVFHSNGNRETGRGFEATVTVVGCGQREYGNCGKPFFPPKESAFHGRVERATDQFPPITFGGGSLSWDQGEQSLSRIVGGEVAGEHSWPWQISIRFRGMHICGGSLVSPRYILSAAHCFKSVSLDPNDFEMWAGKHHKDARDYDSEQLLPVEKIIVHPSYGKVNRHDSDLALIRLRAPGATLNRYVSPICLPLDTSVLPKAGSACYVSGWGSTKGTGYEEVLKQATVPIITNNKCVQMETRLEPLLNGNMMCAGYRAGGHDSCQGDSGGPLNCKIGEGNRWVLPGVVSYGFGCAAENSPGVYVRVTEFLEWLQQHVTDL